MSSTNNGTLRETSGRNTNNSRNAGIILPPLQNGPQENVEDRFVDANENASVIQMLASALQEIQTLRQENEGSTRLNDQQNIFQQQMVIKHAFSGVLNFSGDTKSSGQVSIEDFIRSIDVVLASVEVSDVLICLLVHGKLTGPAKEWFERHKLENPRGSLNHLGTWSKLKENLLERFSSSISPFQHERTFAKLIQGNLSVSAFTDEFQRITSKIPGLPSEFLHKVKMVQKVLKIKLSL
ncbi:hypothetical protein HMI56_005555 [Coelomomyces lativittatus]|nr:hypothetical protein HMI56_005555 [Coelomomyces lativittatus]